MPTIVWTPTSASEQCYAGNVSWTDNTTISLPNGGDESCIKISSTSDGYPFAAIHDGCYIDNIKVEWTGNKVGFATALYGSSSFAGITASTSSLGMGGSTLYSAEGGAGTSPASVRNGEATRYCRDDDIYGATITMSFPTITITYTDNGTRSLFFGNNF